MIEASKQSILFQQAVLLVASSDHARAALDAINQSQAAQAKPELPQTHPSIQWINPQAESLKIDTVRELITSLSYGHASQRYYCLLHADLLTLPAQHALLKSLEEPPPNVMLLLVCAAQENLLETIQSRCQIVESRELTHTSSDRLNADTRQLLQELTQLSHGRIIDHTDNFKDALELRNFLLQILTVLEYDRSHFAYEIGTPQSLVQAEQIVLHHLKLVAANCNTKLVLEECLFQLKKIFGTETS